MLKLAIVENEAEQAELLKRCIEEYTKDTGNECDVEVYYNGIDFLTDYRYDLDGVFMDIMMPLEDGMQIAKKLRAIDEDIPIVFVTSTVKFAIEGYRVNALSYIVKPVQYFDLRINLNKVLSFKNQKKVEYMFINAEGILHKIFFNDVLYIEMIKHNVTVHTIKETFVFRGSLKDVEQKLPQKQFVRCHNSYLVNLTHLKKIENDKAILDTGEFVFISRSHRKQFIEELRSFIING